jgi:Nucleotidyltransferase domain
MTKPAEFWLFGSNARGDADEVSDVDILVAGMSDPAAFQSLGFPEDRLSIVRYEWRELQQMAAYGSLFLHHVALEGRQLQPNGHSMLANLLVRLPAYKRADQELNSFETVLTDVAGSLGGDHSPPFELAVIATTMRHACILGCYGIGQPTFGRSAAFKLFLSHVDRDSLIDPAIRLYKFRLYEDGRCEMPFRPTTSDVEWWLETTRAVISQVRVALDRIC